MDLRYPKGFSPIPLRSDLTKEPTLKYWVWPPGKPYQDVTTKEAEEWISSLTKKKEDPGLDLLVARAARIEAALQQSVMLWKRLFGGPNACAIVEKE